MPSRKVYAREFKIEAVKLVTERGLSQKQVARDTLIQSRLYHYPTVILLS